MLSRIFATLAVLMLAAPMALRAQVPNNDVGKPAQGSVVGAVQSEQGCPTVYGVLGSGSLVLPGTSGTHSPRIFRNGVPSSCDTPESWPGTFGSGSYAYDAYTLTNGTGSSQGVNMNVYCL